MGVDGDMDVVGYGPLCFVANVDFEYLVLSTGTEEEFTFDAPLPTAEEVREAIRDGQESLQVCTFEHGRGSMAVSQLIAAYGHGFKEDSYFIGRNEATMVVKPWFVEYKLSARCK